MIPSMPYNARPYILMESSYRQLLDMKPNVAILPWGATEAHNFHLPHGTDVIEGTALGEHVAAASYERGAKCVLLPTVPFGNDNMQLDQVMTITMRTSTQYIVLRDIVESLVRQGIDRLILLNFHGGNDFKSMIRDVMLDFPIFVVQVHGYLTDSSYLDALDDKGGDHANEMETSLMLHLKPEWVAPLSTAGDGTPTPFKIKSLHNPAMWAPRDWKALTADTGTGNPKKATAAKGKIIFEKLAAPIVELVVELSAARNGDFPYIVRNRKV